MAKQYDAIIIGTGQAGPPLAARLARAGKRVAVIERDRFGGTCVNYGCTPTKALVASARAAHMARRAADFGVEVEGAVRVDMAKVKARKDAIAGASNSGVEAWMKGLEGAVVYEGQASFEGPRQVRVGDELLEAEQIFINVGARAAVPGIEGLAEVEFLTNATLLDLEALPEHLIVLGGGYVGAEFAQIYRRFGSRVTIVERSRLMSKEDPSAVVASGRSSARICWSRWAAGRTQTTWASSAPGSKSTRRASYESTTICGQRPKAYGRWATAMVAAPSPTPRTTTTRSSLATSWMVTIGGSATGS